MQKPRLDEAAAAGLDPPAAVGQQQQAGDISRVARIQAANALQGDAREDQAEQRQADGAGQIDRVKRQRAGAGQR